MVVYPLRSYKNLLVGKSKTVVVYKVPPQTKFEMAAQGSSVEDRAVKKLGWLNVLANEDILLFIDNKTADGNVVFILVKTCDFIDFSEGNCRLAWDHLYSKFDPNTAPLYKIFENCRLDSADKDPHIWISNLKALRQRVNFCICWKWNL